MTKFKVGQILYFVPTKQTIIFPMQVIEELTKKSLTGIEVDYVLHVGGNEPKSIQLKDVQGEIFESADKAKAILTDRAIRSVSKLVEAATKKASEWYPDSFDKESENDDNQTPLSLDNNEQKYVDLGDGNIVRVKLPDILKS